jgi:hypothetical protein
MSEIFYRVIAWLTHSRAAPFVPAWNREGSEFARIFSHRKRTRARENLN